MGTAKSHPLVAISHPLRPHWVNYSTGLRGPPATVHFTRNRMYLFCNSRSAILQHHHFGINTTTFTSPPPLPTTSCLLPTQCLLFHHLKLFILTQLLLLMQSNCMQKTMDIAQKKRYMRLRVERYCGRGN